MSYRGRQILIGVCVVVVVALLGCALFGLSKCQGRDDLSDDIAANLAANNASNANAAATTNSNASNTANNSSNSNNTATNTAKTSTTKYDYINNVPVLKMFPSMSGGCEIVSATAFLNSMGYDITMDEFADEWVEYGSDFVNTYTGDPYYSGACYPPCIVNAMNKYLEAQKSTHTAIEIQETPLSDLSKWLDEGVPVLVWTTMYMANPQMTGIVTDGYEFCNNEHVVVVTAISDDTVSVMDPISGTVERSRAEFESIYDTMGQMAISLSL